MSYGLNKSHLKPTTRILEKSFYETNLHLTGLKITFATIKS
jgi:hypothetical protein